MSATKATKRTVNPKKPSTRTANNKRREILDFARDNNLVIHPGNGYEYYVENFFMFSSCACDPKRLNCPCPEAIDECEDKGWCKCKFYWRDFDVFKESHVPEIKLEVEQQEVE